MHLDEGQLHLFQRYYEELIDWNGRMNLTAITEYDSVQINHFLDALTVALVWRPAGDAETSVLDVGTGAGIPGIPLKIAFPEIELTLLDATARKASFLSHIRQVLGLERVEVVVGRAEEVAHQEQYRAGFGVVLARAVAPLAVLAELALPFCATGGVVIAHKKGSLAQELTQAKKAIALLGGEIKEIKSISLTEFPDNRALVVINKTAATPEKYPRRAGIPAKRPLV